MQKVKVHRYVSGKRPEYAPVSSSEEESEDEDFLEVQKQKESSPSQDDHSSQQEKILATDDPRLRRLISRRVQEAQPPEDLEERVRRRYNSNYRKVEELERRCIIDLLELIMCLQTNR